MFPGELAERVISYYSFRGDMVCDPFAGSGTVGRACAALGHRFVLAETSGRYVDLITRWAERWLGKSAEDVDCVNAAPISSGCML